MKTVRVVSTLCCIALAATAVAGEAEKPAPRKVVAVAEVKATGGADARKFEAVAARVRQELAQGRTDLSVVDEQARKGARFFVTLEAGEFGGVWIVGASLLDVAEMRTVHRWTKKAGSEKELDGAWSECARQLVAAVPK